MNESTTMVTYTFTPAQHAVLAHYMAPDVLQLDMPAQTTLGIDARAIKEAEEDLRESSLLVRPPGEDIAVSGELAALLATTMFPEQLVVLRTVLQEHAQPPVYFSFAGVDAVCNLVDEQGQHVFTTLDGVDEVLDTIVATTGVAHDYPVGANGHSQSLEALMPDCESLTMLLVADDPAQPTSQALVLSWLRARGTLWLVNPSAGESPVAQRVEHAVLRQVVVDALTAVAGSRP